MPNTKRGKYDEDWTELERHIQNICRYEEDKDLLLDAQLAWEYVQLLKRAFPPPAEDAKVLVDHFLDSRGLVVVLGSPAAPTMNEQFKRDWAAEIESFAQSRVEPWREALKMCAGVLAGDTTKNRLIEALEAARAMLSDSPAKEAGR